MVEPGGAWIDGSHMCGADQAEGEVRGLDPGYGYKREQHDRYDTHDTYAISEEDQPGLLLGAPKGHTTSCTIKKVQKY